MNARSSLFAAAACLAVIVAGCTKNPASSDEGTKQQENAAKAQADSDSAAAAMLLPAYQVNREASSHARLMVAKGSTDQPAVQTGLGTPVLGTPVPISAKDLSPKRQPDIAGALLKRAALGKVAAAGGDSTWFVLDDSATGHILWVHAYVQTEAGASVDARDTLIYAWPYGPTNHTVLRHAGARAYANGSRLAFAITDEDGDGMLNEATPGTKIKLRKQWVTVHGDTTWKSVHHTVHGFTSVYDSIGPGLDTGWADTVFVGGKVASWDRLMDGDGDGFVPTAAAGKAVIVNRDAYVELGSGVFRLDHESFGPGADKDFLTAADNERYPYSSQTIDTAGHTLANTRYGDGDGDGFYLDPAAGPAGNHAWIVNEYPANDSVKASTDSLAQILPGTGGAAKVAAYAATREYKDGRKLKIFSRAPGKTAFGSSDTVQIWEKWDLTGWAGRGDADSTLKVTWMIPGVLGDPSDDKLTQSYSQTWNRPGVAAISTSELLIASAAYAPGNPPASGSLTREERRNPVSSKSVIRTVWYQEFGAQGAGASDWRRTDYFESGDSAVSQGSGAAGGSGSYAQVLGPEARNTGVYDAATGAFADTTSFLGSKGETKAREISWGQVDAAKGTGDYQVKRLGGKDTATCHVTAVADGKDLLLTRASGSDTLKLRLAGDSAVLVKTLGGVKRTYTWTAASGAYKVSETDVDGKGSALAAGEYFFGQDLSGSGTLTRNPGGKDSTESHVQFQSDGSTFLDGIRVYP